MDQRAKSRKVPQSAARSLAHACSSFSLTVSCSPRSPVLQAPRSPLSRLNMPSLSPLSADLGSNVTSWGIFFFLMWTVFKVFIELVIILLLFYVLFCFVFRPWGMWDLSSPTRDRTLCIRRRSLNHWTIREVPLPEGFLSSTPSPQHTPKLDLLPCYVLSEQCTFPSEQLSQFIDINLDDYLLSVSPLEWKFP